MALAGRGSLPGGEGRQVRELHETILMRGRHPHGPFRRGARADRVDGLPVVTLLAASVDHDARYRLRVFEHPFQKPFQQQPIPSPSARRRSLPMPEHRVHLCAGETREVMEDVLIDELALVRAERRRVAESVDLAGQESGRASRFAFSSGSRANPGSSAAI
jgi:hypothetical protein